LLDVFVCLPCFLHYPAQPVDATELGEHLRRYLPAKQLKVVLHLSAVHALRGVQLRNSYESCTINIFQQFRPSLLIVDQVLHKMQRKPALGGDSVK
jgi:hypothetical protein